ncbi:MAG: nitroreductase family deazaflavin-dependent oxidoreductase [Chloroflexota bacterium]|nr:MAG: nitroreductase family deazaflavin-dependent oxidoreductase [Chloroflexota bacterium]
MQNKDHSLGFLWRIMRWLNPRISSRFRSGGKPAESVLILSTIGRKSGKVHRTPLQYEKIDGDFYVGSARGTAADWYRNLSVNPEAHIEIGAELIPVQAELITDPQQIADFFEYRQRSHPIMIKLMVRMEGLRFQHTRQELEEFASQKAVVVLHTRDEISP